MHKLVSVNPPAKDPNSERCCVALGFQEGEGEDLKYAALALPFANQDGANWFYIGLLKLMDKTVLYADPPAELLNPEVPA